MAELCSVGPFVKATKKNTFVRSSYKNVSLYALHGMLTSIWTRIECIIEDNRLLLIFRVPISVQGADVLLPEPETPTTMIAAPRPLSVSLIYSTFLLQSLKASGNLLREHRILIKPDSTK